MLSFERSKPIWRLTSPTGAVNTRALARVLKPTVSHGNHLVEARCEDNCLSVEHQNDPPTLPRDWNREEYLTYTQTRN